MCVEADAVMAEPIESIPEASPAERVVADVLTPRGEVVLETYGSHLPSATPGIEVHRPGDVYPRDHYLYWGFPAESLRRLGGIVGLGDVTIIDQPDIDGHPRILATLQAGH